MSARRREGSAGDLYRDDLAWIHVEGYGFHWQQASAAVLGFLRTHGITSGTVVDLGCGGGQWLERLSRAGYAVCGVDVSPAMIRAARRRLPCGRFLRGCFSEVDLPACDAVTSLGEPLNYLSSAARIRRVFRKVYRALRPGGLFVFDVREAIDGVVPPRVTARVGPEWACFATITENGSQRRLERDITTFRKVGRQYRRGHEVHRLTICRADELQTWLRDLGFRVRRYRGYGAYRLGPRQAVYLVSKKKRRSDEAT